MATLSIQEIVLDGLSNAPVAASTGDSFANDGRVFLQFINANASSRTLTIAANDTEKPGFGVIATPDTTVTIPGSGTNGGRKMVGPFPPSRFNNSAGVMSYTLSDATDMTVAALRLSSF